MKQKLLLKSLVLLFALIAGSSSVWADNEVTFSYADYKGNGTSSSGSSYTMTKTDVNITNSKFYCGSSATYAQFYANGTTTITPASGVTITSVVLTAYETGYNGYQSSGTITASTGSVSGSTTSTTVTWTGSATSAFTISNNKQIRWTSIVVTYTGGTPTCATPTFSPAAGVYTSDQTVSISTETEEATIHYTTNGSVPTSTSPTYIMPIYATGVLTVKAIAVKDGYNNSDVATATYAILAHAGTAGDPYSVADARTAIDAGVGLTDVYVTGIVCEGGSELSSGAMNYWISDDGTETNKFEIYKGKGISGANFTATSDVKEGDEVVVTGTIKKYGSTYEFETGSQLVSLTSSVNPLISVTPSSLTGFTYGLGSGPSDAQSFSVEGSNLTADISLSLGESNYEMSLTEGSGYTNSLTLTQTAGSVAATTIYVRLKAGLAVNASYNGNIALTSTGATDKAVSLAGSVTQPNYTFDLATDQTAAATTTAMTWIGTPAVMGVAKGTAGTATNNYYPGSGESSTRFYKNSILTITPISGYSITSVIFTATTPSYGTALKNSAWTNATAAVSDNVVTVTPTSGTAAVSATIGGTCGFTSVKVYYTGTTGATATITLATACTDGAKYYGTYSKGTAFVVPTDMTVSEISVVSGELYVEDYLAGTIVPVNTGVMVSSTTSGDHTVYLTTGGTSVLGTDNMLKPSGDAGISAANMTAADTKFYRLTMHNGTTIGFWWGAADGAAFDLAANKAYLAVPNGALTRDGFWFDDETAINVLENATKMNDGAIYDLSGRRVENPTKGIYIINGKKVIFK